MDVSKRSLTRDGQPLTLNPKAFDLLTALLESRGEVVAKDALLERVWPGQFVEEGNLTVHIAAIRKALGEKQNAHRFIATVPGRGYQFVADVVEQNNGLMIEEHTVSRITVEQEDTPENNGAVARGRRLRSTPRARYIYVGLLLLGVLAAGGFVWQKLRARTGLAATSDLAMKQLTTDGNVSIAALSPDGKLFAYTTWSFGQETLRLGYTSGGNHIDVLPPGDVDYSQLAFSPNSDWLYFSMRKASDPTFSLYRMAPFGGGQEKLLDDVRSFSLSPDGTQIAFGRRNADGRNAIVVGGLKGTDQREAATFPTDSSFLSHTLSWSPDAGRIAAACRHETDDLRNDICLVDVNGGKVERIVFDDRGAIGKTAWIDSGNGLLVTAIPKQSLSSVPHYDILKVDLRSGNIRQITHDLSFYNLGNVSADGNTALVIEQRQLNNVWVAPSDDLTQARQITFGSYGRYDGLWGLDWTPDGRIVFTNSDTETQVISVMDANGENRHELTAPGFIDSALSVSPDGRFVVFHSNRGSFFNFDIWRMDIGGGNLRQLARGNKNYQPTVSADSRYVYYKCATSGVGLLCRVPADGGEPEVLTDKETSWPTFSPDGKYFAAIYGDGGPPLAVFDTESGQIIRRFNTPRTAVFNMRMRWSPDSRSIVYRDFNFGFWSQSIDGGEPQKLEGMPHEKFYGHAWSRDGKQFAFVRGQESRDVVLVNNF